MIQILRYLSLLDTQRGQKEATNVASNSKNEQPKAEVAASDWCSHWSCKIQAPKQPQSRRESSTYLFIFSLEHSFNMNITSHDEEGLGPTHTSPARPTGHDFADSSKLIISKAGPTPSPITSCLADPTSYNGHR